MRPGRSLGRVLIMLGAVGGLFAMHGMAEHGVVPPMAVVASTVMHSSSDMVTASAEPSPSGTSATHGHGDAAGAERPMNDNYMSMAGLCLAVLVGVLAYCLRLRHLWRVRLSAWLPRWTSIAESVARARPPDPPNLIALSIQRC